VADKVRVIEYEIVAWADLQLMGSLAALVEERMGVVPEVGVLRCTARGTTKLTFIGTAAATRALVASGQAGDPSGLLLPKKDFPVMLEGWPNGLGAR
jgi:hypothetical protein